MSPFILNERINKSKKELMTQTYTFKYDKEKRSRIDKFLHESFASYAEELFLSRSRIQKLIEEGMVLVNGEVIADSSYNLKPGDECVVSINPPKESLLEPTQIDLDILYEDDYVLVLNKPVGLVVHPGAGNIEGTLVHGLLFHCGDEILDVGGVDRPGIVHRLDQNTSGLMVIAKNDLAHNKLSEQFAEHSVHREYRALCWGIPSPRRGKIEYNIARDRVNRQKMRVVAEAGKKAVTNYEVIESFGSWHQGISLIKCVLETGRTHQVRVHLQKIGCPIVGDTVYGAKKVDKEVFSMIKDLIPDHQCLHSYKLGFTHPFSQKKMEFIAPLPTFMMDILENLRENFGE